MMVPDDDEDVMSLAPRSAAPPSPVRPSGEMHISVAEFTSMQQELCELKAVKYEALDRERRLLAQLDALRTANVKAAQLEELTQENHRLKRDMLRALEEHQDTQAQLKELRHLVVDQKQTWQASISQLSEENLQLKEQLQSYQDAALADGGSDVDDPLPSSHRKASVFMASLDHDPEAALDWVVDSGQSGVGSAGPVGREHSLAAESMDNVDALVDMAQGLARRKDGSEVESMAAEMEKLLVQLRGRYVEVRRKARLQAKAATDTIAKLQAELSRHQDAAARIAAEVGRQKTELIQTLEERQKHYKMQLEDARKQDNTREQCRLLESEIVRLNAMVKGKEEDISRLTADLKARETLEQQLECSKEECQRLREEKERLDETLASQNTLMGQLQEETNAVRTAYADERKNIDKAQLDLQMELSLLSKRVIQAQEQADSQRQLCEEYELELTELRRKAAVMPTIQAEQTHAEELLRASKEDAEAAVLKLTRTLDKARREHQSELSARDEQLGHVLADRGRQVAELGKELENMRFLHQALKRKVEQLEEGKAEAEKSASANLARQREENETTLEAVRGELAAMTVELRKVEANNGSLKKELERTGKRLGELEAKVPELEQTLEGERTDWARQERKLQQTVKDLKRQLAQSIQSNAQPQRKTSLAYSLERMMETAHEGTGGPTGRFGSEPPMESNGESRDKSPQALRGVASSSTGGFNTSPASGRQVERPASPQELQSIADYQAALRKRDDRLKFYEEHTKDLTEDISKKRAIIQNYVVRHMREQGASIKSLHKGKDLAKTQSTGLLGFLKPTTDPAMLEDMNKKMQAMLEDVLLKNVQLEEKIQRKAQKKAQRREKKAQAEATANGEGAVSDTNEGGDTNEVDDDVIADALARGEGVMTRENGGRP